MNNVKGERQASSVDSAIDEQQVLDFLKLKPEFFRRHPEAIANLSLPHNSGAAVSLVERQVAVLRERSIQTRRKLSELIDIAKNNDELIAQTQQLVIALLKATTIASMFSETSRQFEEQFSVQDTAVALLRETAASPGDLAATEIVRDLKEARSGMGSLLEEQKTFCGVLREGEAEFIFGGNREVGSAAITTREVDGHCLLLLAVANRDPNHYSSGTGTLFIDHIADILALRASQLTAAADA